MHVQHLHKWNAFSGCYLHWESVFFFFFLSPGHFNLMSNFPIQFISPKEKKIYKKILKVQEVCVVLSAI